MPDPTLRPVGRWLALWSAMLVLLVVIGGVTRLTESGLSITEWKPVTGIVPPLSHEAWEAEFARYQQIPEYQLHAGTMTLGDFQRIYFWEYLHRLWARLLGLAFALPLAWFVIRGQVRGALARRLGLLLVLLAAQGALGWYMVRSGLVDRTDVSQYRLAAHLGLALLLYGAAVWMSADLLGDRAATPPPRGTVRRADGFVALTFLTILAGAFVAGLDAGKAWNTFPLMGGSFVPPQYGAAGSLSHTLFEDPTAVQFHHRWLGIVTFVSALALWWHCSRRDALPPRARRWAAFTAAAAALQAALGIATLLLAVPIPLAAVHQFGAVMLLTGALLTRQALQAQG